MSISKRKLVEIHLISHKTITSLQAFSLYAVTRLSAVIFVLREEGWKINSIDKKLYDHKNNLSIYSEYKFISKPAIKKSKPKNKKK